MTTRFSNASASPLGRITLVGMNRNLHHIPDQPLRTRGSYALAYLLDGKGFYKDENGLSKLLEPGDCILVFPTLAHRYGPRKSEHWTEFYLVFDGPVFKLWEETGLLSPRQPIHHLEPINLWLKKFESILGGHQKNGVIAAALEICRLQLVLSEIILAAGTLTDNSELKWSARACALLESDYSGETDLHDLASQMGTSYDHFRKRFQKLVGMPPARYRTARIMDRACELMASRVMTDKQIAEKLGFCDEFHFSRRFKEIAGVSPRKFRQHMPGKKTV